MMTMTFSMLQSMLSLIGLNQCLITRFWQLSKKQLSSITPRLQSRKMQKMRDQLINKYGFIDVSKEGVTVQFGGYRDQQAQVCAGKCQSQY